jgi:ADP-ribose pyrophosphatase
MSSFKLLKSEILMQGRAFTIRRDTLETPDNRETKFEIIEHIGSVVILPLDNRHAASIDLLELPAGTLDNAGEKPEDCAAREIREETGMATRTLTKIGEFFLAPGYSTEFMHVFLATDLYYSPLEADADEFLSVQAIPAAEAIRMAERSEIPDAKSLAALMLARSYLERNLDRHA